MLTEIPLRSIEMIKDMVCTNPNMPKDKLARMQELIKLLHLDSFRFLSTYENSGSSTLYVKYECDVKEHNKLTQIMYSDSKYNSEVIKPWSRFKKFKYKIINLFNRG